VPFTRLSEATQVFLASSFYCPVPVTLVDVSGSKWAYLDYMAAAWERGEDFLTMEHDTVPWPGAIETLLDCPNPWCFFGFQQDLDFVATGANPLGLARFRAEFIAAVPDIWRLMRISYANHPDPWRYLDVFLNKYATRLKGWRAHQHYPAVLNANPKILTMPYYTPPPVVGPQGL
jgi:hypothetical protein